MSASEDIIFGYEWNSFIISPQCPSISNGVADKSKYIKFRDTPYHGDNKFYKNAEHFREINEQNQNHRIVRMCVKDIPAGQKYVYNIPVKCHYPYFFNKFNNGFDISDRVIQDIKNGSALLVFEYVHEGYIHHMLSEFNALVKTLNLPKERILFLHGDYNTRKFKDAPYMYEPVDIFTTWMKDHEFEDRLISYEPDKLYVSYSRMTLGRKHRIYMMLNLIQHNLINDGYVSMGRIDNYDLTKNYSDNTDLLSKDNLDKLLELSRFSPDNVNLDTVNPAFNINVQHHRSTFLSLVNETLFHPEINFFSEKIYKPISIGHPFILNGNPYQLKRLKDNGFKTFSEWWDESYDTVEDVEDRIKAITSLLLSIRNWSKNKMIEVREQMKPLLLHNQKLYYKLRNEQKYESQEIRAIKKYL